MSNYTNVRDKLEAALWLVEPDGPEYVKTKEAISAVDAAELASIEADFVKASAGIDDAIAKLRAIVASLQPNVASGFLDQMNGALALMVPIAQNVDALLSGEPATALPGMREANEPAARGPAEPMVAPVREVARAIANTAAAGAASAGGVDRMIDDILHREGGYVDHPSDRGGPTNFGITQRTLAASRGRPVSIDDVRNMAIDEAKQIYRTQYFTRPKIDALPELLQPILFDMSINHGPGTAIKMLQSVLNDTGRTCSVDGGIGDATIACARAAAEALGKTLVNKLVDKRIAFYEAIVAGNESQRVFLRGWLNRANEFLLA